MQRYGKEHLLRKAVRGMKGDAHLDFMLESACLESACEAAGLKDVAEF